jgi:energy-coupling factor transporter ATP-binding protein EcfA2
MNATASPPSVVLSSKRGLGSGSAEHDNKFDEHFVSTPEFARLAIDECAIVIGAKGSGKTALMRALAGIYRTQFVAVHAVKLDELKFGPLFASIKKLDAASNHGVVGIARAMWQNVVAIFVLEGMLNTKLLQQRQRTEIRKYLLGTGHLGTATTEKLSNHLERIWSLIVRWSREAEENSGPSLHGMSPRQHAMISAFPSDANLGRLLALAMEPVKREHKPFLLCFDGLDSVVEHSLESRDIIFAGLIDAAYKCVTNPLLKDALSLKILLPKELAHGARRHLRDLDKEEQFVESIHWGTKNLGEFLKRRLEEHVRLKNRPFDEVWREYFPERIRNDSHNVDEDTFEYVLRHTLYRPRQLLLHVQWLLNKWDARDPNAPFRVDPTFVPKTIGEGNIKLTEYVVNELRLDFPNLETFLRSFRGVVCVLPWPEVQDRMERFLCLSGAALDEGFTDLYNYGVFGVKTEPDEGGVRKFVKFRFGFMTPEVESNVVRKLTKYSLIALSPMLVEYCGCKASPVGVVVPAE